MAADVQAQEAQPGLFQHILACIRAWANEAALSSYLAPPNLAECALWLPHALGPAGAPKQLPSAHAQHSPVSAEAGAVANLKGEETTLRDKRNDNGEEAEPGQRQEGETKEPLEKEDEHVEWEEVGEVSATVAEGSEFGDSEEDPRTMFGVDEQHGLVEAALGESETQHDNTVIGANW